MNKKGHSNSLVPAHPANTNALKAGVFSPRIVGARSAEIEVELIAQPVEKTVAGALLREVAAMIALAEAMDASLATEGLRGRRGEPRNLIQLRLRLNDKLRHTLAQYLEAVKASTATDEADAANAPAPIEAEQETEEFIEGFASFHFRASVDEIKPADFDPEAFLRAVVVTNDPAVSYEVKLRARKLLTSRASKRPELCTCAGTLMARDELELRDWIADIRAAGAEPDESDPFFSSLVRRVAQGERLEWSRYRRTCTAIQETVDLGVRRLKGEPARPGPARTQEQDAAVQPFWEALLDGSGRTTVAQRLKAFKALEEIEAFPVCSCHIDKGRGLAEDDADAFRAYVIRSVGQRHYRGALVIAYFPETYCSVRDAVDAKVSESEPSNDVQPGTGDEVAAPAAVE